MFWKLIGLAAAALTSFAFFPQVIKMYRTKSSKDISFITLLQLSLGVSLWILYGIYLRDGIIILANSITLISLLCALALHYRYAHLT
jgi:MtN3 and saliva related transmembrane protein